MPHTTVGAAKMTVNMTKTWSGDPMAGPSCHTTSALRDVLRTPPMAFSSFTCRNRQDQKPEHTGLLDCSPRWGAAGRGPCHLTAQVCLRSLSAPLAVGFDPWSRGRKIFFPTIWG